MTMNPPVQGRICPIGQHICLLLKLKPSDFKMIYFEKFDKYFPCLRSYIPYWYTRLSPSQNQYLCFYVHWISEILQEITLFQDLSTSSDNKLVSFSKTVVIFEEKVP